MGPWGYGPISFLSYENGSVNDAKDVDVKMHWNILVEKSSLLADKEIYFVTIYFHHKNSTARDSLFANLVPRENAFE
jgi:hypothetical protein